MPDSDMTYEIQITCLGVPDAWANAPVPFQILGPRGKPEMVIWRLADNMLCTHKVTGPGTYTVRAELPSGARVSETVVVSQGGDSPDSRVGKGTLELYEFYPTAAPPQTDQGRRGGNMVTRPLIGMGGQFAPPLDGGQIGRSFLRGSGQEPLDENKGEARESVDEVKIGARGFADESEVEAPPDDEAEASGVECVAGFFEHWNDSRTARGQAADIILLRPNSAVRVPLTSVITTEQHPGWSANAEQWRPLVVVVANVDNGRLIVWPPTPDARSLELEWKQDEAGQATTDAHASAVISASLHTNSPLVNTLYAYTRNNALECAQHVAPSMIAQAEELLRGKMIDPLQATVAAYALLKINEMKKKDWLENLAERFQYLPDGAILYGTFLIRSGEAPQAASYFLTALHRGIPMYTEGLQLLRDGLNFLSGLNPAEENLHAAAARANRLFFAGNLNSQLTCLDLGDSLKVEFPRLPG